MPRLADSHEASACADLPEFRHAIGIGACGANIELAGTRAAPSLLQGLAVYWPKCTKIVTDCATECVAECVTE
eukprot:6196889-Pleurochrysis_carterae.AAC.2